MLIVTAGHRTFSGQNTCICNLLEIEPVIMTERVLTIDVCLLILLIVTLFLDHDRRNQNCTYAFVVEVLRWQAILYRKRGRKLEQ